MGVVSLKGLQETLAGLPHKQSIIDERPDAAMVAEEAVVGVRVDLVRGEWTTRHGANHVWLASRLGSAPHTL